VTKDEAIELGSVGGALIGLTLKTMTFTDPFNRQCIVHTL
jgi:hypothetical protein